MADQHHTTYWFNDGSTILHLNKDLFRLHGSLLARQSSAITSLLERATDGAEISNDFAGCQYVQMNQESASSSDFVMLLEHLYHDE